MKAVLASLLGASCLAQENVHIPIFLGPSGWHVNVSVDYHHDVSPILSFENRRSVFGVPGSGGSRMISLFPQNDITGVRGSSVDIHDHDLRTFEGGSRTERISKLRINYYSSIFGQMGPIAVIKNPNDSTAGDLVLRSTIEEFEASCLNESIVYLENVEFAVRARLHAGEDEDLLSGDSASFDLGDTEILSIPNIAFRRYIGKMVDLGAVEVPPSDSGSTVLMNNCTIDLVAQLPPIRIYFQRAPIRSIHLGQPILIERPGNPYIEFTADDLISVNQETRRCGLVVGVSPGNEVRFNPLRVPFMNVRIGGGGDLHFCDSGFAPSLQSISDGLVLVEPHTSQVAEQFFPLVFSHHGGHIMVQVDNNGSALVEMIVCETAVTRLSPEDIVPNNQSLTSSVLSIHGIPSDQSVFEMGSLLAIGPDSWILAQFGSVAVIRNAQNSTLGSLVLSSTSRTFFNSCVPNTMISKRVARRLSLKVMMDFGNSHFSRRVQFEFDHESQSSGIVAAVPGVLAGRIERNLRLLGATDSDPIFMGDYTVLVMDNCSPELVQGLPPLTFQVSENGGHIRIPPIDYIRVNETAQTCHLLIGNTRTVIDAAWVYPLRIPSWNTRYTSDGDIQICNAAFDPPHTSEDLVLNTVTRTVPVVNEDHVEAETRGNFFRRFLQTARCAFRAFGCRSR